MLNKVGHLIIQIPSRFNGTQTSKHIMYLKDGMSVQKSQPPTLYLLISFQLTFREDTM